MNCPSSQRGSAIIMLFIAVALFGALAYAYSRGTGSSVALVTDEQTKTYAQQIIAYGDDIKTAVKRLQLRGCTNTQISFENSLIAGYTNPTSPTDKSCHVFEAAGAGMAFKNPPAPYYDPASPIVYQGKYYFMAGTEWVGWGTTCATAACTDVIMILSAAGKMDYKICQQINRLLGLPEYIEDNYIGGGQFVGTYYYTAGNPTFGNEANSSAAAGKPAVCLKRTTDSAYIFMQLLFAQ